MLANLKQPEENSFLFFDPRFSWHGGFTWWHGKFAGLIEVLSVRWHTSFAEARRRLAQELACIELIPYHSASFRDPGRWIHELPSAQMARRFVQEFVQPRVISGEAIVIVARQSKVWDLTSHDRVVRYEGSEARSAHLTPKSRGGLAILEHMGKR
jgi:hypothetical protein